MNPDDPRYVDVLLRASGLSGLGENAPAAAIEGALRTLAAALDGADPLRRAMVREEAIRCVKRAGGSSPVNLVDTALGLGGEEAPAELQGHVALLSGPVPWPKPVDGAALLDGLARVFGRFVALPEGAADTLALWTVHAHALDATFISPILALTSPTKRCGKTLTLEILGALVPRRLFASSITAAALFRAVEEFGPTLLVDEADTFIGGRDELRGILNAGHTRTTAVVVRTVGDDHKPRTFSTWCAKALALIGSLPPTLEDRAIVVSMRRRASGERVTRLRRDRLDAEVAPLPRRAARWAADHLDHLRGLDPVLPEALHDRAQDNWRPLVAIAEAAGGGWPERARRAALLLSGSVEEESAGVLLLADLRGLFRATNRLSTVDILEALNAMEERPWAEYGGGKPLTERQLARLLRPYRIRPRTLRRGLTTFKGYRQVDLEDAFTRYLPPRDPSHPSQSSSDTELDDSADRNTDPVVTDTEGDLSARDSSVVTDVTDQSPQEGGPAAWKPSPDGFVTHEEAERQRRRGRAGGTGRRWAPTTRAPPHDVVGDDPPGGGR